MYSFERICVTFDVRNLNLPQLNIHINKIIKAQTQLFTQKCSLKADIQHINHNMSTCMRAVNLFRLFEPCYLQLPQEFLNLTISEDLQAN